MSFEIFSSDSYELNVEENNDINDDFDFEVNEDDVKEMLFDDNYDSSRLLKETPTKCTASDRKSNCEVVTPLKDELNDNEAKNNHARNLSNLITLTEVDNSENPEKSDIPEDDDDEDEEEERHAKFRSERYKSEPSVANTRKSSSRDIPDSLDKVVLSPDVTEHINGFNDQKKYKENKKLRKSKNFANVSHSKSSPNKIHINPHFRPNRSPSNHGVDNYVNNTFPQPSAQHSTPRFTSSSHACLNDQQPLLPLPVSTSFASNNHPNVHPFVNQNNFQQNTPFSENRIQGHSMNNQQPYNSLSSHFNLFPVNNNNPIRGHLMPQQQPPFTDANYWQPSVSQNEKPNSVWCNPPIPRSGNVASTSAPYLTQSQASQFPASTFLNNFSYSGTVGQPHFRAPLCPNPQNPSPHLLHQRSIFQESSVQNPRFLPQHIFAARFPQQYPPSRVELPSFPRPEPIPALMPTPISNIVERCQVPQILGTTTCRTLLPNPILNQPPQLPPPPQVPPTQLLPPRLPLPQFTQNADFGILQSSREFLQQPNDKSQQYRNDVRMNKRSCQFSAPTSNKFMKTTNKLLRSKYSGLKTVVNGTENETRKFALSKTKMAKKFLQKRPGTSVKQIPCKPENNVQTSPSIKVEMKPTAKPHNENTNEKIGLVDLEVDDDYKKALEQQKQLREEVLKRKEERRRLNAMQKLQEVESQKSFQQQLNQNKNSPPFAANSEKNSPIKTLVNRAGIRCQNQATQRERQVVQVKQTQNCISNIQKKTVKIKGLALSTNETSINKLCNSIGVVNSVRINQENGEKTATVVFDSPKDAALFQQKYQRHLLDLCVIQVSLV